MQQSKKPPARSEAKLSIGALSQATAIPVANLRTWERRYGFPVPEGKPSGQRLYPLSRVVRIFDTDRDLGDRPMKRWLTSTGLIGLLLLAALAPRAMAQCNCVVGDGRFTTHTGIVIDGNRADWAAVLADPDNNSCDGGAPNIPPQPDLDAPVQSTGRDLLQFVYTWDNTHVATLTDRVASSSNVQKFIYYADTNNNGWMETGERVVVATWQGSNRQVDLYLGWYSASQPGGDPMVSPVTGLGDGYRLPGQVTGLPSQGQPHYTGFWGTADGLWMEWRVPWNDAPSQAGLGIAPGSAFSFHVSSTNSTPGTGSFPAQVDDNMAGCGGGPASTQYAGVVFDPDRNVGGASGSTVYASHTVVNTGNGSHTFDLAAAPPTGGHTPNVAFYRDTDRSGTFTPGDVLLTDTGGTEAPDTGPLAAGATLYILIAYGIAPGASGTATVVSTARSVFDTGYSDTVTDLVTAERPQLFITKSARTYSDPVNGAAPNAKAIPGACVDYTVRVENQGRGTVDANSIRIADPVPGGTRLFVGDLGGPGAGPIDFTDGTPSSGVTYSFMSLGDPGDGVEFSNDHGASFTYVPVPDATGFDSQVTTLRVRLGGVMNGASGGNPSFTVRFRVAVHRDHA